MAKAVTKQAKAEKPRKKPVSEASIPVNNRLVFICATSDPALPQGIVYRQIRFSLGRRAAQQLTQRLLLGFPVNDFGIEGGA